MRQAAMSIEELRAWMAAHGHTNRRAAAALGLAERTIAGYLMGERAIPRVVYLATRALSRVSKKRRPNLARLYEI